MSSQLVTDRSQDPVKPPSAAATKPSFRPEVQGLRALAVLMVVTYHIWFGRVSGGVDIFLLISAFLLTLSFLRKAEDGRPLDLGRYWLRQFKRLLPPVAVVLVGTLVAAALFIPPSRWTEILSQSWSSLLYFQNWALAAESVDYYAADHSTASPLQHFWSLSVQGQVFILWPVLFAVALFLARIGRLPFRRVVLAVFGTVFVASLGFSVVETYGNQAHAYFDTRTRLWEFALGTLLALALPYLRPVRWLRVGMGWLGLAVMLSVGFVLDVQGEFPGYVALVPLLAAALIIIAGQTGSRFGADRLLSWKPLRRLGDMSYALYLWHWPVLVVYLIWRDREEVGIVGGTAIIGLSLVLAYLTTRFIERPLQSSTWVNSSSGRSALVIALCLALVAAPVAGWQYHLKVQADRLSVEADRNNPGAAVLLPGYQDNADPDAPLIPLATELQDQWPQVPGECTKDIGKMETSCEYEQDPNAYSIAVLGSSHADVWATPLVHIVEERNWNLTEYVKGYCPLTLDPGAGPDCLAHNRMALDAILEQKPDLVVTMSSTTRAGGPEYLEEGWSDVVRQITDAGIKVAAIRDTPRMPSDVPSCVEDNADDMSVCGIPAAEIYGPSDPAQAVSDIQGLHLLDFTDLLCPDGFCEPVIGNVMLYMDNNHLTSTYLSTVTPFFAERLDAVIAAD